MSNNDVGALRDVYPVMETGDSPVMESGSFDVQDNEMKIDTDNGDDFFVEKDGQKFAGLHLLVELWDASGLNDPATIERVLKDAAVAANATVLHSHMHHFSPSGGVSGVVVLAESHISIHTWPERDFAAIDIFMCGKCDAYQSLPTIEAHFKAGRVEVSEHRRGMLP